MKQLLIDARMCGPVPHGIARYVESIYQALLKADLKHAQVTFLIAPKAAYGRFAPFKEKRSKVAYLSLFEPFLLRRELRGFNAFHGTSFAASFFKFQIPYIVTIHDLIHWHEGHVLKRLYYAFILRPFARNASKILTVSQFSADLLHTFLKREVEVVPNVALPRSVSPATKPLALCLSGKKRHKRRDLVIRAFKAARPPYQLSAEDSYDADNLAQVFEEAEVILCPSQEEGFGLVPLEGAIAQKKLVVSDIPAHREVLADIPEVIWASTFDDWVQALKSLKSLPPVSRESAQKLQARFSLERFQTSLFKHYRDSLLAPRVAVIHDWLVQERGGERVLKAILECFPQARVFTLFSRKSLIETHPVHVSALSRFPGIQYVYKYLLPLFPLFIRAFRLESFDLVISSSHCVAKGVRVHAGVPHVSYVHTPMRYIWDRGSSYVEGRPIIRFFLSLFRPWLRWFDVQSSKGVTLWIANSLFTQGLIEKFYQAKAQVVVPFCDAERFWFRAKRGFYLFVGAQAPYKRVDLAIEACTRLKRPLVVVANCKPPRLLPDHVLWMTSPADAVVARFLAQARFLLYPGIEDFGIQPLEALASGTPVIAMKEGGALETLNDETAVWIETQDVPSLIDGILRAEARTWDPFVLRRRALLFSRARFKEKFLEQLRSAVPESDWEAFGFQPPVVDVLVSLDSS